jgi:6,7-dimethyl-8-ribityllumazine synthase
VKDRIGIVVSRFNEDITYKLLLSCVDTLKAKGVGADQMRVVHVPGGYEIPWAVQELALTKKYAAVIALGCILKGETPQNDHIARSTIQRIQDISLSTRVPCILGVITPNDHEQAVARTKGEMDRGKESALAALDMVRLRKAIHKRSHG